MGRQELEPANCVFVESGDDFRELEEELLRAVLVSIGGPRPAVDLASAADAIVEELMLAPGDISIRAYYLEDFLVLCKDMATRNKLVDGGRASTAQFSLVLRPWMRQAQATGISMPFLVPLALKGVPANAWTRRTAEAVLWGLGLVVKVAESTAHRHDMAVQGLAAHGRSG